VNAALFVVRSAHAQDGPALVALEQLCVNESESFRGSSHLLSAVPLIGHDLGSFQTNPQHVVLVIESSNEICGFAQMEIAEQVAMVRRVYVSVKARDLGAGATLIDELRTQARLQGCTRIDAYALPGDRLTKNLFERAGMKARLLIASSDL
jgi:ribosomal protein S18 acetylase RimI-like enzyme